MNRFFLFFIVTILGLQFTLYSCKTDELKPLPVLTTLDISEISEATALCGGNITSDGGVNITSRGICLSKLPKPTTKDTITSDSVGTGTFVSHITKLSPNTTYYVRAYATNKNGTAYGDMQSFISKQLTLTTDSISEITVSSATCSATIKTTGNVINVTERGICWNTQPVPTVLNNKISAGSGSGNYSCTITNISLSTTYYARMYITNSSGTYYGNEISFKTKDGIANLTANTPFSISSNTASFSGSITSDGGSIITERGFCWSKSSNPTVNDNKTSIGTGIGSFTASLRNLSPNTKYYVCAYATNNVQTTYSNQVVLTTNETLTDIEGNSYNTVTIGTQTWMSENLKTTKFSDGAAIPLVTDVDSWTSLNSPAYCWYNNDATTNKNKYGALYNYYTVITGKLAPNGWHISTLEEWKVLANYLGQTLGSSYLVGKALATTTDWTISSPDSPKYYIGNDLTKNNISGFSALPGGYRGYSGNGDSSMNEKGVWWTSTFIDFYGFQAVSMTKYSYSLELRGYEFKDGLSVRCIKD